MPTNFEVLNDYEDQKLLVDKLFEFILQLQQGAAQLKMNHWQTKNYAEHKITDNFINTIIKYIDKIAETTIGELGRPKINTTHLTISDNSITSTIWVLNLLKQYTQNIIEEIRLTKYEGILDLLGEFDAKLKKTIYLSSLE